MELSQEQIDDVSLDLIHAYHHPKNVELYLNAEIYHALRVVGGKCCRGITNLFVQHFIGKNPFADDKGKDLARLAEYIKSIFEKLKGETEGWTGGEQFYQNRDITLAFLEGCHKFIEADDRLWKGK